MSDIAFSLPGLMDVPPVVAAGEPFDLCALRRAGAAELQLLPLALGDTWLGFGEFRLTKRTPSDIVSVTMEFFPESGLPGGRTAETGCLLTSVGGDIVVVDAGIWVVSAPAAELPLGRNDWVALVRVTDTEARISTAGIAYLTIV